MATKPRLADIGAVPEGLSEDLTRFLVQTQRLLRAGFASGAFAGSVAVATAGGASSSTTSDAGQKLSLFFDATPPPTPTAVIVDASSSYVLVETAAPTFRVGGGYDVTQVFIAQYPPSAPVPPTFADAVLAHEFIGQIGAAPAQAASRMCVWVKWRSLAGYSSSTPAGGINGFEVTTGSGTGYDSLMAARLSVGDLVGGTMAVGQVIKSSNYIPGSSGFRINHLGNAEFSDAVLRGTIFASQGAIGGINIGSNYIQSSNWVAGTQGFRLASNGTGQIGGLYVTPTSIQTAFQGFSVDASGYGNIGGIEFGPYYLQSSNWGSGTDGFMMLSNGAAFFKNISLSGGGLFSANNACFLNLNATGNSDLLSAGNGKVRITAAGDAYFLANVAQGVWNGSATIMAPAEYTGNPDNGLILVAMAITSGTVLIDTGVNIPIDQLNARSFSARVWGARCSSPDGAVGGGVYSHAIDVTAQAVQRVSLYGDGGTAAGGPYGVVTRMMIRIDASVGLPNGRTTVRLTQISWTLDSIG